MAAAGSTPCRKMDFLTVLALPGLILSSGKTANPTAELQPPWVEPISAYPQLPIFVQEETLLVSGMCQLWGKKINKETKSGPSELPEFVFPAPTAILAVAVPTRQQHRQDFGMQTQGQWGLRWGGGSKDSCKHWICFERGQASLAQDNGSL